MDYTMPSSVDSTATTKITPKPISSNTPKKTDAFQRATGTVLGLVGAGAGLLIPGADVTGASEAAGAEAGYAGGEAAAAGIEELAPSVGRALKGAGSRIAHFFEDSPKTAVKEAPTTTKPIAPDWGTSPKAPPKYEPMPPYKPAAPSEPAPAPKPAPSTPSTPSAPSTPKPSGTNSNFSWGGLAGLGLTGLAGVGLQKGFDAVTHAFSSPSASTQPSTQPQAKTSAPADTTVRTGLMGPQFNQKPTANDAWNPSAII